MGASVRRFSKRFGVVQTEKSIVIINTAKKICSFLWALTCETVEHFPKVNCRVKYELLKYL